MLNVGFSEALAPKFRSRKSVADPLFSRPPAPIVVGNGANIDVTGNLLTLNGNSGSTNAGSLTVTYAPYDDATLKKRYGIAHWRRL